MTSRLDYYNALLDGCPVDAINKLQPVQIQQLECLLNFEIWSYQPNFIGSTLATCQVS